MVYKEELYIDIKTLADAWLPENATKEDISTKIESIKKSAQRGKFCNFSEALTHLLS